ncbi:glycoside hydrolase family 43 protein [Teredinibacter franksiae]|uniref:glycoside hydrolase family 43 protein n=1 Tax=Teredinibacter franksiae TaxID=2761453 RepID=UPI0016263393|nr:glycoside hydrolase 43 family protein [Teredinibacter franksiae]
MNNTFYTLLVLSWVILSGCGEQHSNQIPLANNTPTNNTPVSNTLVNKATSTEIWQADLENGNYQNPILYADYSDPDVVRVGDDYFMTASSFNSAPGLPVLHSKDMVNWTLIGHALNKLVPENNFAIPQHGNGVWAPNIRYHNNKVWIFYPDPDYGIYMLQTEDPFKGWSEPKLILPGKGIIDPTPMWDDDGQSYLLHGWAKSRSGINNILTLHKMSADGTQVEAEGETIIDGHKLEGYRTLEGPKFYKRNGYYYVFAPAGGVPVGWQAVFRAKNIYGPYEHKSVMEQGTSLTNGPHQGAWVTTQTGEDWFFHFQSKLAHGRIVHLQPMQWVNDWPVIGEDKNRDGVGQPVTQHKKPNVGAIYPIKIIPTSDTFDSPDLGKQWQWAANYKNEWYSLTDRPGYLRLFAQTDVDPENNNLWMAPAVLFQKISGPKFIAETTIEIPESFSKGSTGLMIFGEDYAWAGIKFNEQLQAYELGYAYCHNARTGCGEGFRVEKTFTEKTLSLRASWFEGGGVVFSYLDSTGRYKGIGELFQARRGRWVGAKIGLFARTSEQDPTAPNKLDSGNYIDYSGVRIYKAD